MKPAFALLLSSILAPAYAATYSISDTVLPSSFLSFFDFEAIADPTHGRVNYVDQSTAVSQGLVSQVSSTSFVIKADSTTVLNPSGPGRNSVRIRSKKTYATHVAVFDLHHMPQGCGTWPAVWETNEAQWPNGGEIDIVEGVNDQSPNAATLHTGSGCTMPASRDQTGANTQLDCDAAVNGNTGCGVRFPTTNSFGPEFNSNGGGWFAVERSSTHINIFFWPRNSGSVPSEVKSGASSVNPDNWGTPVANFPNTSCDLAQHFSNHNIIINLTFCGDWAGSVYGQSGCPSTCEDFVNNNPSAFNNAYFDFASIRVYQ
ncbi:putative glycosidase C21B10.07 [Leucoagaricus sp. SymC.cos]|nr:putative glycosidase C21B10.07 [Leucoagaricus sp. SymC.cos]